jgi:hypothetical protein
MPDEAYRLEEQARHDRRPDEAHYWARYREGLEGAHPKLADLLAFPSRACA